MKVLIVGYGSIAKKHINALKLSHNDVQIIALRSSKNYNEIEGVESITEYDDIPNDIDFILISNPTNNHYQTIVDLLPLKKDLFIEKPSIHTLNGVDELLNSVCASNIKTYVACNLRFLDSIIFLKKAIDENRFGRINEVNVYAGSYLPDWRPDQDFRKCYSANASMGGGVHLDLVHELDYVYWFFGFPVSMNKTLKSNCSLKIDAVSYANYTFEYSQFCVSVILNYYRKEAKREIELVTENGILKLDLLTNKIEFNGELIFESEAKIIDTYKDQMDHFIGVSATKDATFENDLGNSINVLKMCLND